FTPDGSKLISVSEDQTIKVWETQTFTELAFFDKQSAVPSEVAVGPEGKAVLVGRLDGSRQIYNLADAKTMAASAPKAAQSTVAHTAAGDSSMTELAEVEPNNTPEQATPLAIPAAAKGVIESAEAGGEDVDLY